MVSNNSSISSNTNARTETSGLQLTLSMILFEGFELLDAYGPLEMFGQLKDKVRIVIVGEKPGFVKSFAGPATMIESTLADCPKSDIIMIPGGMGTRKEVNNELLLNEITRLCHAATYVASICTGAALLAKTGLLDNRSATTNKKAFEWVTTQGPKVHWVKHARWVEDGKFFTSSGVSAGTDMALALIAKLFDKETALDVARIAEYEWNSDPNHDPFALVKNLSG